MSTRRTPPRQLSPHAEYTIYSAGLSYTSTGATKGYQVIGVEDGDEADEDGTPYLINDKFIEMIRAAQQDEGINLVEPAAKVKKPLLDNKK